MSDAMVNKKAEWLTSPLLGQRISRSVTSRPDVTAFRFFIKTTTSTHGSVGGACLASDIRRHGGGIRGNVRVHLACRAARRPQDDQGGCGRSSHALPRNHELVRAERVSPGL